MIPASSAFNTANAELAKHPIVLVKIAGYSRVFTNYDTATMGQYKWIESMQDQGKTVNDLSGVADTRQMDFVIIDGDIANPNAITGDFPTFLFEGKPVQILTGFVGMSQADFACIFAGVVGTVDSTNDNTAYSFTFLDNTAVLTQTIYTTGDNGLPISSESPRTLNAHPLDLLIDILTNQITAQDGQYWDPALVDLSRIKAYRDGVLAGAQMKFSLTSPVVARDFIAAQLLVPLGGYLWMDAGGKFTVNFFYPIAAPASVFSLNEHNIKGIPSASQAELINSLEFRFDSDGSNYFSNVTEQYSPSVVQYGIVGTQAVQSDGMRSGLQGFLIAAFTSHMIFLRYAFRNLSFGRSAGSSGTPMSCFWTAAVLEPGDLIDVTSSKVPDRQAGVMGITAKLFEVLETTYDFSAYTVTLTVIDAGYLAKIGLALIAPNNEPDYTSAGSDKPKYMFLCDTNNEYSNSDPGNILG